MNDIVPRTYWIRQMLRIAKPVLRHLANRELKARMPVECQDEARAKYTHLEALGRTLAGIAPWLDSPAGGSEEANLRAETAELARQAIDAGTDPDSPDYLNFTDGMQPIVDAAFLAHALIRAPRALWEELDEQVKSNLIAALKPTRRGRKPAFCNWLLFSAMIEAALARLGEEDWDRMRVDYALRQHEQWYLGDGVYGDGPDFHWDYYNSFVIQPMLIDVLLTVGDAYPEWERIKDPVIERARRYAAIQERLIAPDGTYPIIGRSSAYRFGAFQLLTQIALMKRLPEGVAPAQVRSALTAVLKKTLQAPDTFDPDGWLRIGVYGHQPELGEPYISTGSLYLCTTVFLPLGLSPDDPFWIDADQPWTAKKLWAGASAPIDHALHDR